MARKRIKGRIAGEYQEGAAPAKELNSAITMDADTEQGLAVVGDTVIRGPQFVRYTAYLMALIIQGEQARAHANRPIHSLWKPEKTPTTTVSGAAIPPGYQICPSCSTGLTDPDDCGVCDCAGMIRLKDPDDDQSAFDD